MSGDERDAKDIAAGDEKISDTETSSLGELLVSEETVSCAEEELLLPGASVGGSGAEEGSRAGGIDEGSTEKESLAGGIDGDSTQEEALAGAVGGCEEATTASETLQKSKVVIGIEDLQKALLRNAKYKLSQFQGIKDDLVETIKELKELSRKNPGNWEVFERLRDHIKEANAFLEEINEAMTVQESREQYMNIQINQFFERRREQGEHFRGTTFNLGTIEDVSLEIQTASGSSSAQKGEGQYAAESIDRSHLDFVDQMMHAARFGSRMGEMDDTKAVQASVGVGAAGGAAEEPDRMEEVERADDLEDRDEEGRLLHPPVTGKYTLAITAHQLYPESSSEDSPEQELPLGAEGRSPRQIQQRNIAEVPAEDPSHGNSSSDSSNDEHRDHYGL